MLTRVAICLLAGLIAPHLAMAQENAADANAKAMTSAEISTAVREMQQQLSVQSRNLTAALEAIKNQDGQLAELRSELNALQDEINNQLETQRQILDALSTSDSSGQTIPRLSSIMDNSPEFRQDMQQAVQKSLKSEGQFHVHNKTASVQRLSVNGQQYDVQPGATMTLKVPIGTVTTQLPGESLQNWSITAPSYEESIDLVPKSASTVVLDPVISSPTSVYYHPLGSWVLP